MPSASLKLLLLWCCGSHVLGRDPVCLMTIASGSHNLFDMSRTTHCHPFPRHEALRYDFLDKAMAVIRMAPMTMVWA